MSAAVITNDVFLKDTSGNPIYAQGGGVFNFGGKYYWYGVKYNGAVTYYNNPAAGENGDTSFNAFTCYSSTNLVDWQFENNVMTSASPGLGGSGWVGRMGVAYNATTQKYVLLSQFTGNNGSGILFATCSTPNGTFVYDHIQTSVPIVNNMTGDQTMFLDTDGTAYLICSSAMGRSHLYVLPLRPSDYLNVDAGANIYNGNGREGNMMFKYNGRYYFCSSDLHGWNASHCYVIDSANLLGTYSAEYVMNRSDLDFCHVSQTGFGVTVSGTNGTTVLFVGDRWCDFAGNGVGYNQWIPVSFNGATPTFESVTAFELDAAAGTWSVAGGNNYVLNPGFEADRVPQTDVAGWINTGSGFGNASGSHNPGNWHFTHFSVGGYTATTHQLVTGLPAGTYTLKVWYRSSGGQAIARIFARDFGGMELDANINTAQASWAQLTIPNIAVINGQCDVGLYSVASANQSADIDDWSLTLSGPPPPGGLAATSGDAQVSLNWTASPGATGYKVKRSTTSGGPYSVVASPATNNWVDATVLNGTNYYYVVSATNALGESPDSTQVSVVPSAGPIILAASASPNPVYPGQALTISATVTPQAHPIASITVDVSAIGGSINQVLISDGAGQFTNSVTVDAATSITTKTLTVHGSDDVGNGSAPYSFLLVVSAASTTWDGGAADNNWSSPSNWVNDVAPGINFSLIFAGSTRLTPVMESSYSVYAVTFDGSAGAFNLGATGGTMTLAGGVTNNSANVQTVNLPMAIAAPATFNAASADLVFGQDLNNGGNLLTITDGGHNTTVLGAISGAGGLARLGVGTNALYGLNSFTGAITISNGTLAIAGAGQLGGGSYSGAIVDNGTLLHNSSATQNLAGSISGTGGLLKLGTGTLTLSAVNTFSGGATLAAGGLTLAHGSALQNSTLNFNNGSIAFSGITAATLGGLAGTRDFSLVNGSSAAVALTVGGNNSTTTFAGSLSGPGSLTKVGTGTLTLTGSNSYAGNTAVNGGTLELPSGGVIHGGPLSGGGFLVDGGTLISTGTTSFNAVNNAFLQTSGTSALGDLTEPNSDGLLIRISGGSFSASSLTLRRTAIFTTAPTATSPVAASTATGLHVNGPGATVRLGALTLGTGNSSVSARVDAGNVVVTNQVLIGRTSNTRWEILQVNGGSFTSLDAVNGIVLSQNNGSTPNNSELYLSGGTTTAEKIAFGVSTDTVGGNGFLIVGGGTLYLGSGGIVRPNTAGYNSTISLLNGTLGAKADWSSTLPMLLSGASFAVKAADAANAAHDISLSGALSGAGSLIKTGAGSLALNAVNNYTGATTVNAGKLSVNGSLAAGGAVTIASGGQLGGTGTLNGPTTIQSGGTLSPGSSIGTLTFSNSLTLLAGCTNLFEISKSPITNDVARIVGPLACGGTLVVTNLSANPLAAGDSFKLFNATSYGGAFNAFALPPLSNTLAWDTTTIHSNGILKVIVATPPAFASVTPLADRNFRLTFVGSALQSYEIRASTNLTLAPITDWTLLGAGVFPNSPVVFDDLTATNFGSRFYLIRIP